MNKIHIVYSFIEDSDFKIFVVKIDIQFILVNYAYKKFIDFPLSPFWLNKYMFSIISGEFL